jgi:hypothetical protein
MAFNPLAEKGIPLDNQVRNWSELSSEPYDPTSVDPYTRARIIAMNGIEVEAVLFSHQMNRHVDVLEVRQKLAATRRIEQQQQKAVNWLLPGGESTLEVTLGYEQLAIDITAFLARSEPDPYVKNTLDFGLLEDFDHLYRYANLYELLEGKKAESIVGTLTEMTPGRPTIMHHRDPVDNVRKHYDKHTVHPLTRLHALTITALEQQTMNFYMTIGNRYLEPIARSLYAEIAMVEEEHVTQYESLLDPAESWYEQLVHHEYNEIYMYWSFLQQESDPRIKKLWQLHLDMEITQLHQACDLLRRFDGKEPEEILPKELPDTPVLLEENKQYVRSVLAEQLDLTSIGTGYAMEAHERYQANLAKVNAEFSPSEQVIDLNVAEHGREYRLETEGPNPIPRLRETSTAGRS